MRIYPFQALYPNEATIASFPSYFKQVKEDFLLYLDFGIFNRFPFPSHYIYEIESESGSYKGIISSLDIQDYFEGKLIRHEGTVSVKEQRQKQLILQRQAVVKPILLTYSGGKEIGEWQDLHTNGSAPFWELYMPENASWHRIWAVHEAKDRQLIETLFHEQVHKCYIADGHHRTVANASIYRNDGQYLSNTRYQKLFTAFFPSKSLEILPYHRMVSQIGLSETAFLEAIKAYGVINPLPETLVPPKQSYQLTFCWKGSYYQLKWHDHIIQSFGTGPIPTDTGLLNELILKRVLNIQDLRTDKRIKYLDGNMPLQQLVATHHRNPEDALFYLHPISVLDLMTLADEGIILPPKSTWFQPRLINGMLVMQY